MLFSGGGSGGWGGIFVGAASIFMAYEGFQLLSYDYEELRDPKKTLRRATLWAVPAVILIYVLVTLGSEMLIGNETIVEQKEVALAVAGRAALGQAGRILVSIAAAFSTGSAIKATLFATARLARAIAQEKELPKAACHLNRHDVPDRAIIVLGIVALVMTMMGSLSSLVEAASLTFLFTFATVNVIAFRRIQRRRWIAGAGAGGAGAATILLTIRLAAEKPVALGALAGLVLLAVVLRPWILRKFTRPGGAKHSR